MELEAKQQLLVLLLVMQAERQNVAHRVINATGIDQLDHLLVDVRAVVEHFLQRRGVHALAHTPSSRRSDSARSRISRFCVASNRSTFFSTIAMRRLLLKRR